MATDLKQDYEVPEGFQLLQVILPRGNQDKYFKGPSFGLDGVTFATQCMVSSSGHVLYSIEPALGADREGILTRKLATALEHHLSSKSNYGFSVGRSSTGVVIFINDEQSQKALSILHEVVMALGAPKDLLAPLVLPATTATPATTRSAAKAPDLVYEIGEVAKAAFGKGQQVSDDHHVDFREKMTKRLSELGLLGSGGPAV